MIGEDQRLVAARVRLAEEVERHCALLSSRVVEAFLNVPRYPFVPVFYRHERELYRPWRGTDDAWLEAVYTDRVLVTEVDGVHAEDAPDDGVHGVATSSSTLPGLMADMLDALDVRAGDRVLEIGTGTGYNAALLCHLAGDRSVTTVDRTERLAAAARERLRGAGSHRPSSGRTARPGTRTGPPSTGSSRPARCGASRRPGSTSARPVGSWSPRSTAPSGAGRWSA